MNKKWIAFLKISLLSMIIALTMTGCKKKETDTKKQKAQIVTAKMQTPITRLYFDGTLNPLHTDNVLSPVDGRVVNKHFEYGQRVAKGQVVVVINSTQLEQSFRTAVQSYLEKKATFANSIESYQGEQALYKAGVVSREDFLSNQNSFENTVLDFYTAKIALEKVLKKAQIDPKTIEDLTIADTTRVRKLFRTQFNHILVKSDGAGVALFPIPGQGGSGGSDDSSNGRIEVGTQVKEGQLLISVGDLTGFSATVQVSEININRIKPGMPVTITGDAFPGLTLQGVVTQVASQANPSDDGSGNGLSMFTVNVKIPHITKSDRALIHVGMTAHIAFAIKGKPRIVLPINAVFQKDGQNRVTLMENGKTKAVPVLTGPTMPSGVTIISGIKPGDKVVVRD